MPPAVKTERMRKAGVKGASCLWVGTKPGAAPCQRAGIIPVIRRDAQGEPWFWKLCRTHATTAHLRGGWLAVYG